MKSIIGIALFFVLIATDAKAEAFKAPDILIDSKLDYDWSKVLVSKVRLFLKNYKMDDPFIGSFPQTILVNESELQDLLPTESKELIQDFGDAVGLSFVKTKTKVHLTDFSYEVKDFKTDLKASQVLTDGFVMGADFSASEVLLSAENVSLSLSIPQLGSSVAPVFKVDIVRPSIHIKKDSIINFFTKIKIQENKDFYKLNILQANFEQMAKELVLSPESIELDYERIIVPQVAIKIGSKTVNFSPEKVDHLIRNNHQAIKGILLAQVAKTLRSNTMAAAFKIVEEYKLNKEYWLDSSLIKSQIKIGNFSSSFIGNNIEVNLPGDFCTTSKFNQLKNSCVNSKVTQTAETRLDEKLHKRSVHIMKEIVESEDADIVASISEDYLNKLLVTTYDAGLWKQSLDEAGVDLGPNKVVMKLDKKGESGTLMMDVIYKPSKIEKMVTGSKVIRFPLVLDVSVRIEKHDNEPVIIVRLNDVDTSDDTLINGRPLDNIISTVKDVPRFRSKVTKAIRDQVSVLRGKDVIELRYPQLSGLGLDKVDFLSDGNGRMNAVMRLEDLIEDMNSDV